MTPSFEKLLTHFGLSMGKLRCKSHPTMIAIATDRGASTSWSVSTTVLRTKCTNIQRVLKHWDNLMSHSLFDSPQPRST